MSLASPVSGYSTQARLSLEVARIINNGRLRFWFSAHFNPLDNPPASNPLLIFAELDKAAKGAGMKSVKASSIAHNLRAWIADMARKELLDPEKQGRALFAIKTVSEWDGFQPVVFYLARIVESLRESGPDEYRAENLSWSEDPRVRQILPPLSQQPTDPTEAL